MWGVQDRDGHCEFRIGDRPNHWKEDGVDDDDDDKWGIIMYRETERTCHEFVAVRIEIRHHRLMKHKNVGFFGFWLHTDWNRKKNH